MESGEGENTRPKRPKRANTHSTAHLNTHTRTHARSNSTYKSSAEDSFPPAMFMLEVLPHVHRCSIGAGAGICFASIKAKIFSMTAMSAIEGDATVPAGKALSLTS